MTILTNPRTMAPLTEWMAEEGAAPGWLLEIDWDGWRAPNPEEEPERVEQFNEMKRLVEEFVATKTKDELYLRAVQDRMMIAPCNSVGDIARSVQLEARDFWTKVDYPSLGRTANAPWPVHQDGRKSDTGQASRAPKSASTTMRFLPTYEPRSISDTGASGRRTLPPARYAFSGMRVLDFTWVGVGPITIKHLADFGADVIRIESVSRPDVLRNAAPFKDGVAGINRSQFSASYNTSKRGLGLNLASPEGRDLVRKIIREWKPDVIAESFTPRVMRGWGLGYSDVRELLPRRDLLQHVPAGTDRAALRATRDSASLPGRSPGSTT